MKKSFAFAFYLKVIFFAAFWILRVYEEWLFDQIGENNSWNFDLDIHLSWYHYALMVLVIAGFLSTTVAAFLYLYRPGKNTTQVLSRQGWSRVFFCIELLLFGIFCFFTFTLMPDAFEERNDMVSQALNFFLGNHPDNRLRALQKADAINWLLGLLGVLLSLLSFWRFRARYLIVQTPV